MPLCVVIADVDGVVRCRHSVLRARRAEDADASQGTSVLGRVVPGAVAIGGSGENGTYRMPPPSTAGGLPDSIIRTLLNDRRSGPTGTLATFGRVQRARDMGRCAVAIVPVPGRVAGRRGVVNIEHRTGAGVGGSSEWDSRNHRAVSSGDGRTAEGTRLRRSRQPTATYLEHPNPPDS